VSTESTAVTTWLSPEAHARLTATLEELTGPVREDIVRKISAAREEGDLRENGGYHAAKEEQGKHASYGEQPLTRTAYVRPEVVTVAVIRAGSARLRPSSMVWCPTDRWSRS